MTDGEARRHQCVACGEEIASGAVLCCHCQTYQGRIRRHFGISIPILSLLIALVSVSIPLSEGLYPIIYPKDDIFPSLNYYLCEDDCDNYTVGRNLELEVTNESSDSVSIDSTLWCYRRGSDDSRSMLSYWTASKATGIIQPGKSHIYRFSWAAAEEVTSDEFHVTGQPFEEYRTENRPNGCCGGDGADGLTYPTTSCIIVYRTPRHRQRSLTIRAEELDEFLMGMSSKEPA